MKGNEKVIATLNFLLADELTAISQYMVHAEMFDNWKYKKLAEVTEKRAITEMKHAEKHIGRILFLEGQPVVSNLNKMSIGSSPEAMLQNDKVAEMGAVKSYNEAIATVSELGDNGTVNMLTDIISDEEDHLEWIEAQLNQIKQLGLQNYLVEQL